MKIVLDGSNLTIDKLVQIARFGATVELAPAAIERIKVCRAMLERKLVAREIMYGTNTGIGEFSEKVLDDKQVKEFQRFLVYNHAAGIGDPLPIESVRAALAGANLQPVLIERASARTEQGEPVPGLLAIAMPN